MMATSVPTMPGDAIRPILRMVSSGVQPFMPCTGSTETCSSAIETEAYATPILPFPVGFRLDKRPPQHTNSVRRGERLCYLIALCPCAGRGQQIPEESLHLQPRSGVTERTYSDGMDCSNSIIPSLTKAAVFLVTFFTNR